VEVLELMPAIEGVLAELARVVKPGGCSPPRAAPKPGAIN